MRMILRFEVFLEFLEGEYLLWEKKWCAMVFSVLINGRPIIIALVKK